MVSQTGAPIHKALTHSRRYKSRIAKRSLFFFIPQSNEKNTQLRKLVFFTFEVYFAEIFSTSLPLEAIFARRRRLRRCRRRRR